MNHREGEISAFQHSVDRCSPLNPQAIFVSSRSKYAGIARTPTVLSTTGAGVLFSYLSFSWLLPPETLMAVTPSVSRRLFFAFFHALLPFSIFCVSTNAAPFKDCPNLPWATLRIVNGKNFSENKFSSFNVLLRSGPRRCSASLLSAEWILLAAHCRIRPGDIALVAGHMPDAGKPYKIKEVVSHPDFAASAEGIYNDIALAQLYEPVDMSEKIAVALGEDPSYPKPDTVARASGYGVERKAGSKPGSLRYADLEVIEVKKCAEMIRRAGAPAIADGIKKEVHICANDERCGAGICAGDSGGPLTVRGKKGEVVQIGITSFRLGKCGIRGYPDIFTRVASYKEWIQNVTEYAATFADIV